jgi:outer membrane protein OmpA-like peptidoglycan-associated protein
MAWHSFAPRLLAWTATALFALIALPTVSAGPLEAQILRRIKETVKRAAEDETMNQIDRLVRGKVRCVFDDLECIRKGEASGEGVVLTDDEGEILVDEDGHPVSDPDRGAEIAQDRQARPGEGAWANYDFVPGDEVLIFEDFTQEKVGDFPRRFDLVMGNWEVVDWEGGRYLRATSNGVLAIPLPEALPERFTIEFSVNLQHGGSFARLAPGRFFLGPGQSYRGSAISIQPTRAGIAAIRGGGPESMSDIPANMLRDEIVPVRVMADAEHMRVYLKERRVANVPNAVFPRTDSLFLVLNAARQTQPILIGPIRIAGGGRDLYDRLARDGRVATQGILFATNSDRIRPESTPTLEEIGQMLKEHAELRIAIEGHTDGDGEEAYNQELSERRAAAVKAFLIQTYGIQDSRLQTAGFGESKPVADNTTPEGKQQNRRVELVRVEE